MINYNVLTLGYENWQLQFQFPFYKRIKIHDKITNRWIETVPLLIKKFRDAKKIIGSNIVLATSFLNDL